MNHQPCKLANGFTTREKVYAQTSFVGMGVVGTTGIALIDWPMALLFLSIYLYGIFGVVMRHLACPRCPHLSVHNDCLQAPPAVARWLIKRPKTTPFSPLEKGLFISYFTVMPLFPIYWLLDSPILLVLFVASAATWFVGQYVRFCRACRVQSCPFNRVSVAS